MLLFSKKILQYFAISKKKLNFTPKFVLTITSYNINKDTLKEDYEQIYS